MGPTKKSPLKRKWSKPGPLNFHVGQGWQLLARPYRRLFFLLFRRPWQARPLAEAERSGGPKFVGWIRGLFGHSHVHLGPPVVPFLTPFVVGRVPLQK